MPDLPATHRAPAPQRTHAHAAQRPKTADRGYGSAWRRLRLLHLHAHPLCEDCLLEGRTTPASEVDHVTPLARGGTHDDANLRSLCKTHHSRKTARHDRGFGR